MGFTRIGSPSTGTLPSKISRAEAVLAIVEHHCNEELPTVTVEMFANCREQSYSLILSSAPDGGGRRVPFSDNRNSDEFQANLLADLPEGYQVWFLAEKFSRSIHVTQTADYTASIPSLNQGSPMLILTKEINRLLDRMDELASENPAEFIQDLAAAAMDELGATVPVKELIAAYRSHRDRDPS